MQVQASFILIITLTTLVFVSITLLLNVFSHEKKEVKCQIHCQCNFMVLFFSGYEMVQYLIVNCEGKILAVL